MPLSSQLRRRFTAALESAFPTYNDLRIVVGEGDWTTLANPQLEKMARPDTMDLVRFDLVRWLESHGRIKEFATICLAANPQNDLLRQVVGEIGALPDEPPAGEDRAGAAIDAERYPTPPSPLAEEARRLSRSNTLILLLTAALLVAWTSLLVDGAWIFWTTVIGGIATIGAGMLTQTPSQRVLLQLNAARVRYLASRRARNVFISIFVGLAAGTLFAARLDYAHTEADPAEPVVVVAGKALGPGETGWLHTFPVGRTVELTAAHRLPKQSTLCPWWLNKIRARDLTPVPCLVIEPHRDVLVNIVIAETDPQLYWKLRVLKGGKEMLFQEHFLGGPVRIGNDDDLEGIPLPAGYLPARPDYLSSHKMEILPNDEIDIEIIAPNGRAFTRKHVVKTPSSVADAAQLVLVHRTPN